MYRKKAHETHVPDRCKRRHCLINIIFLYTYYTFYDWILSSTCYFVNNKRKLRIAAELW